MILISFLISYHFWWRVDLNSFQGFIIAISTGMCWIGIFYLSTFIVSNFIFKNLEDFGFVSPFTLALNDYFSQQYGLPFAQKFKNSLSLIAFPSLIVLIALFYLIADRSEEYQLTNYGIEKQALIKETFVDKRGKVAIIEYKVNDEKYSKILVLSDTLKNSGEFEIILVSTKNPYIIEWKNKLN